MFAVPLDYSYLPSSSLLHSIVQLCQALLGMTSPLHHHLMITSFIAVHCRDDHTHIYILNCLLSLLSLHKSQLPPANFSSLFLPVLCGRGFGAELQQACIRCFTRNKKVQGFRGLGQYLTHPSVFPCLPVREGEGFGGCLCSLVFMFFLERFSSNSVGESSSG